jgi:hypothetical protein
VALATAASSFHQQGAPATRFPLPSPGDAVFYFLTDAGVFEARALERDVASHGHALLPLHSAAQDLITRFREHEEAHRAGRPAAS